MLYISITFDYELFMGKNYVSENDVLIAPTRKLCKMLQSEGVSATFFADVFCPIRYRELGQTFFPDSFDNQLKEMAIMGHDVQLHTHPHWLKATQVGENVVFERKYYRLHNWMNESGDTSPIKKIIHQGKEYLENVMWAVDKEYKCIAFRSGGYCLQPESLLAPLLISEGIKIDSSVCYGHCYNKDGMAYDYTNLSSNYNFFFNDRCGLRDGIKECPRDGGLFEVPVFGYNAFPYRAIASRINRRISKEKAKGCGMALSPAKPITKFQRIKNLFTAYNMLTFDFFNAESMIYMINKISHEGICKKDNLYISIISHPKIQTNQHITNMQRAIQQLKKNKNICFVSLKQIADIKGL